MKKPLILPLLVLALPLVACGDTGPTVSTSSSETETGGSVVTSSATITGGTESSSSDIEAGGSATSSSSPLEGGGTEDSSNPDSEPEPELAKTLTFDEAYGLLKTASEHEKAASKETRRQVDTTATDMSYSYLEEETLDIYEDGSAEAKGTVTSFEDGPYLRPLLRGDRLLEGPFPGERL